MISHGYLTDFQMISHGFLDDISRISHEFSDDVSRICDTPCWYLCVGESRKNWRRLEDTKKRKRFVFPLFDNFLMKIFNILPVL